MKTNSCSQSRFFCVECGNEGISIIRKKCSQRETGHLKRLYCIHCQKEVNHVEIRDGSIYTEDDFRLEFELGRFVKGNRISLDQLYVCQEQSCKYNVNNKCWNANNSFKCEQKLIKEGNDKNENL